MAAYRRVDELGHLRADCRYTGISSGPNAQYGVWESLFLLVLVHASMHTDQFSGYFLGELGLSGCFN